MSLYDWTRAGVRASIPSNMYIFEISGPNAINFYLKHHWAKGKSAIGFEPDQIRPLVSKATDSPHRAIMGEKRCEHSSYFIFAGDVDNYKISAEFEIRPDQTTQLSVWKKSPWTYNGRHVLNTTAPSFLIGSSLFLQVTRTCITTWMGLNFNQIQPQTTELPALERLKNQSIML